MESREYIGVIGVAVPAVIVAIGGSAFGALSVLNQVGSNGDTTLNLGAKRAKPCSAFEDVRERLPSQNEAQKVVYRKGSTDVVCYKGALDNGLTWYSTGGH